MPKVSSFDSAETGRELMYWRDDLEQMARPGLYDYRTRRAEFFCTISCPERLYGAPAKPIKKPIKTLFESIAFRFLRGFKRQTAARAPDEISRHAHHDNAEREKRAHGTAR